MSNTVDIAGDIVAYESGALDEDGIIALFQHLIDTGLAWSLQGSYGRTAAALIDAGYCSSEADDDYAATQAGAQLSADDEIVEPEYAVWHDRTDERDGLR